MKDYAVALWGAWRPANTLASLNLANHEMIEWQGISIGCLASKLTPDALHLTRLYIAPDAQNRGIGEWVLWSVIKRANRLKLAIKLSVLTTNPAIRFYMRHGFIVECTTPERHLMIRPFKDQKED